MSTTRRPSVMLAWLVLAVVAVAAFVPGLLTDQSPIEGEVLNKLQPPSGAHWFGTDYLGRDVYTRVVHGTSVSLRATVLAVGIAFGVGSLMGLVAGYVGGWVDSTIMRVVDVLLAIPTLLLSLAIVAALGFGATNVAIAVGVASVASFARLTRSEVLRIRTTAYVEAASALGVGRTQVLTRHVLPNAIGPALVLSALEFGSAILAVSALSFLGYGEPPPAPEWGKVVAEGRDYLATAWWTVLLPSLIISAVALSANRLSRAYDDRGNR
jgi:peptide/nickel transport system permease protein